MALTSRETARIVALLDRLDPQPAGRCAVPGCIHLHAHPAAEEPRDTGGGTLTLAA